MNESVTITKLKRVFPDSPTKLTALKQTGVIILFGLILYFIHELSHLLIIVIYPNMFGLNHVNFFPLFTNSEYSQIFFSFAFEHSNFELSSSYLQFQIRLSAMFHFFSPFISQCVFLYLVRKKFPPVEFKLWVLVSLLLLRMDFIIFISEGLQL